MAKNLIIVESPAKVKTIKKFLGRDYAVEASVGHVRDLPASRLGVDEKKGFAPEYGVIPGKQKVVSKLREAAAKAEHIYLAPDPDREGEAIAWHVAELIRTAGSRSRKAAAAVESETGEDAPATDAAPATGRKKASAKTPAKASGKASGKTAALADAAAEMAAAETTAEPTASEEDAAVVAPAGRTIQRIQFNEITSRAVKEALAHPRPLDESLFNSQQARRILDRLVGYKLSPLLWSKVKRGISAGRVQSVALRLIVDREKERQAFVAEEYWVFKALLRGTEAPDFEAELAKVNGKKAAIGNAQAAQKLYDQVAAGSFSVAGVEQKERQKSPAPPFITSTLQQEASRRLGFGAKRTMGAAQKLYEGVELGEAGVTALITYMRTDSVRVADEARHAAKDWIVRSLGAEYYPEKPRFYKTKAGAQDAHEAVRPVDVNLRPEDVRRFLPADLFKLYTLIWQRFVASQMASARFWDTAVDIANGPTLWKAKGQRMLFPGFLSVYGVGPAEDGDKEAAAQLPPLEKGQQLAAVSLTKDQRFTQPPPRFSEASLVKELEELGIGRPSTYAAIISTLVDRAYATLLEKRFVPTELGVTVVDLLARHFTELMDTAFTAQMEERLDDVATGKTDWVELLSGFTGRFYPTLTKAQGEMKQVKGGVLTDVACEVCGKPMSIRFGKNGEFLGCSDYPTCKNIRDFVRDEQGVIKLLPKREDTQRVVGPCPRCGKDLHLKKSRTGSRFVGCSGYPKCDHTAPMSTGVPCPREGCAGTLVEKSSRRGKVFYSCDQYPKCDMAVWDWPVAEPCPDCDSKILTIKVAKDGRKVLACPKKGCRYRRDLPEGHPALAAMQG